VSSGAIAEGIARLAGRSARRPSTNCRRPRGGADGTGAAYESIFRTYDLHAAQVLLTHEDLADRARYLNARSTLRTLLGLRVVPIINENDTVATDEIRLGDNDTLGALVTNLIEADCLVILTDQTGLYTADPRRDPQATLVMEAHAGDPELERMAGGAGSSVGTGGMLTKILAARRAARSGAHTVICCGREEQVLLRLAAGEAIGSQLIARQAPLAARRQWLADHLQLRGGVVPTTVRCALAREQEPPPRPREGVTGEFDAVKWWRSRIDGREIAPASQLQRHGHAASPASRALHRDRTLLQDARNYPRDNLVCWRDTTLDLLRHGSPSAGAGNAPDRRSAVEKAGAMHARSGDAVRDARCGVAPAALRALPKRCRRHACRWPWTRG